MRLILLFSAALLCYLLLSHPASLLYTEHHHSNMYSAHTTYSHMCFQRPQYTLHWYSHILKHKIMRQDLWTVICGNRQELWEAIMVTILVKKREYFFFSKQSRLGEVEEHFKTLNGTVWYETSQWTVVSPNWQISINFHWSLLSWITQRSLKSVLFLPK